MSRNQITANLIFLLVLALSVRAASAATRTVTASGDRQKGYVYADSEELARQEVEGSTARVE